jgi:hypothetical protein
MARVAGRDFAVRQRRFRRGGGDPFSVGSSASGPRRRVAAPRMDLGEAGQRVALNPGVVVRAGEGRGLSGIVAGALDLVPYRGRGVGRLAPRLSAASVSASGLCSAHEPRREQRARWVPMRPTGLRKNPMLRGGFWSSWRMISLWSRRIGHDLPTPHPIDDDPPILCG